LDSSPNLSKAPFLLGVFLLTFSLLTFQIVQTRILSVIAWYYMAFFAISVAMLGMTVGAVWVFLHRKRIELVPLPVTLTNFTLATALAMPVSIIVQFCLITTISLSLTTVISWSILMVAMAVPYFFSGVVVSLALTRSPFPAGQVYGVDLVGAALGCMGVIFILNIMDGPTAVIVSAVVCGGSALAFMSSANGEDQRRLKSAPWWRRPAPITIALAVFAMLNSLAPVGVRPIMVKDQIERFGFKRYEKWNSYSRITVDRPQLQFPDLWSGPHKMPPETRALQALLTIDGGAGTWMSHYDGTPQSISYLQYDLVGLAYRLPGIHKSAVVGVGGGRDLLTAHYFGVPDITGVELNPITVNLLTNQPYYKEFTNVTALPNLKLHVDDARSWFDSTHEKFDLVQMSMIDTWASTGAGAFTLSENGLYTLEGWNAFLQSLNEDGIFTVSRWHSPDNVDETGRMIGMATAALLDSGVKDVRPYIFVASAEYMATLVLSKRPFTPEQLRILNDTVRNLGFNVLLAPDHPAQSPLLRAIVDSPNRADLNRVLEGNYLDLSVPTDNRPFFFNQLRFQTIPSATLRMFHRTLASNRSIEGNLIASLVLGLILFISIAAVIVTILLPLRGAARESPLPLVRIGSLYFSLIGMGFMLAEIPLLERFSLYLGHPIYSLSVCLFSLILASGLGSITSDRLRLNSRVKLLLWGCLTVLYLAGMAQVLPALLESTTGQERLVRIGISVAVIMPLGFLLGFAFPTGLRLVEAVDRQPTPWFWGINGATSVLASVLAVLFSMALGIKVTVLFSSVCYLLLIPTSIALLRMGQQPTAIPLFAPRSMDEPLPGIRQHAD
jgi:spermidine synthase